MEKIREYKYDNLKFILIFLVVLGHLLELLNFESINKIIYIFHMPIFIYISGYFSKCDFKSIIKKIYIYIIWQTIYFLLYEFMLGKEVQISYFRQQIWILWYIFALIVWESIILIIPFKEKLGKQPLVVITLSFIISLLCGFIDKIGGDYSLSRIISFFPFFLLGFFHKKGKLNLLEYKKGDKVKICAYSLMAIISIIYFIFNISEANIRCFYWSFSYKNMGYTVCFRLMLILLNLSMLFLLNNTISNKKIKYISKIGSNTMPIYLIHGIIVRLLDKYARIIFVGSKEINLLICIVITILILVILGNDYISKYLSFLFNIKGIKHEKEKN